MTGSTDRRAPACIFLRLLSAEDKGAALVQAVSSLRAGQVDARLIHEVDPAAFAQVPGSPFAYWVSDRIRRVFAELPPFEREGRTVRVGLQTSDNFRFVRAWWEVSAERILDAANGPDSQKDFPAYQAWCRRRTYEGKRWAPFAKGGEYSPYYADVHLLVNWEREGEEMKAWADPLYGWSGWSRIIKSTDSYFRPGLTWPLRTTSGFAIRALPAGCIFAHIGPAAFVPTIGEQYAAVGVLSSRPYQCLIEMRLAAGDETASGTPSRSYEVGIVQALPWPDLSGQPGQRVERAVRRLLKGIRDHEAADETTREHRILLGNMVGLRAEAVRRQRSWETEVCTLLDQAATIDLSVAELLGVPAADREATFGLDAAGLCALPDSSPRGDVASLYEGRIREAIQGELASGGGDRQIAVKSFYVSRQIEVIARIVGVSPRAVCQAAAMLELMPTGETEALAHSMLGHALGATLGRWSVPSTQQPCTDEESDPFAPVPVSSGAMLQTPDGIPARETPPGYPIRITWSGILVDDPGLGGDRPHPEDIVRRIREALDVLFPGRADAIEQEACEILGYQSLRDYFRAPGGLFAGHLSRYSKSRRKAPIYWPLSTKSGSYTLWIYYHRLDGDLLFRAVNEFVNPKVREVEETLESRKTELDGATGRAAGEVRRSLESLQDLRGELLEFRDELLRVANLPYRPNLDDGVLINAAPLWRLFRLPKWRGECEACWKELEAGAYEWAHLAYTIWPERVEGVCRGDRSIALAHGLEELYEGVRKAEGRTGRTRAASPVAEAPPALPSLGGAPVRQPPARGRGAAAAGAPGKPGLSRGAADGGGVLSAAAEQILTALRAETGPLGRAALVELAGISEASWLSAIRQLRDRGLVRQIGERRGAVYGATGGRPSASP